MFLCCAANKATERAGWPFQIISLKNVLQAPSLADITIFLLKKQNMKRTE